MYSTLEAPVNRASPFILDGDGLVAQERSRRPHLLGLHPSDQRSQGLRTYPSFTITTHVRDSHLHYSYTVMVLIQKDMSERYVRPQDFNWPPVGGASAGSSRFDTEPPHHPRSYDRRAYATSQVVGAPFQPSDSAQTSLRPFEPHDGRYHLQSAQSASSFHSERHGGGIATNRGHWMPTSTDLHPHSLQAPPQAYPYPMQSVASPPNYSLRNAAYPTGWSRRVTGYWIKVC